MRGIWIALVALLLMAGWLPGQSVPASRPAQEGQGGWEAELESLVGRLAGVQAISGEFVQTRYTPMLRRPMVSSGRIRMAGGVMRWDTEKPSKSVLLIDQEGAKVYLPEQSLLEIYSIDAQTLRMASSPVPDLARLRAQFEFAYQETGEAGVLGVVLRPRDESLKEHVSEVRLRIDRGTAFLKQMEMVNADGERTVVQFPAIEVRQDLKEKDLELSVPRGTRVSRPLEGGGGGVP